MAVETGGGPKVGKQTQGSMNQGLSVGYDPVPIPKVLANAQLGLGGIQVNENQRMPIGMGTEFYRYTPNKSGSSERRGAGIANVAPTPGKTGVGK
jgi:hypothetical protein